MNLGIFNNLKNDSKENHVVQNFIKELTKYLETTKDILKNEKNKNIENNILKQENCLYQVIEMDTDGAYLQNISNNCIAKETDISKDILSKIENDSVLRFTNENYIYEKELTNKFHNSLIDIKEYKRIQNDFMKESNILQLDADTKYKIESHNSNYYVLSYQNGEKNIKVPKALIPFWAKEEERLYYKNGKFNRDI